MPATEAARLSALAFADGLAARCTDALGDAVLSLEREPALGVVEDALRQRTVDPAVSIGSEAVGRTLAHVRRELRRGAPRYAEAPS